jgi:hypothetical protein
MRSGINGISLACLAKNDSWHIGENLRREAYGLAFDNLQHRNESYHRRHYMVISAARKAANALFMARSNKNSDS